MHATAGSTEGRSTDLGTFAFLPDRPWLAALLVAGTSLLVFLPAVTCGFVNWDDGPYVYENPLVLEAPGAASLRGALTEVVMSNWAPLTILSYQIDATIWGITPAGFHLTNVLLHAASSGLFFMVLARMTGAPLRSAAAALLFAVHPLRVEPVVWVSSRKDVLSVFFLVLTLVLWERYSRRPSPGGLLAAVMTAIGCMLAKSTLVTLPLLLLLLDFWPLRRCREWPATVPPEDAAASPIYPQSGWRRLLWEKIPFFVVAAVFAVITMRTHTQDVRSLAAAPSATVRAAKAAVALEHYCVSTIWPVRLHPVYDPVGDAGMPQGAAAALGVTVAVGIWLIGSRRRFVPGFVGMVWFLAAILPVSGITTQVGQSPYADRHTYPAHIGLAILAAWGGVAAARWLRIPARMMVVAFGLLVAVYVAVDQMQIAHWRNREALWAHVVAVDPRNMVGIFKQALALEEREELPAAEARYRDALAVGDYTKAIAGLGRVYVKQGRIAEAFALRDWALRRAPGDPAVNDWLEMPAMQAEPPARPEAQTVDRGGSAEARALSTAGMRHARRSEYREALELFRRAAEVDPEFAAAHNNAGLAAGQLGDRAVAERSLREAVRLAPDSADYAINLARLYLLMGRHAEALPLCERAASLAPADPEITLLRDRVRARLAEGR